MPKSMTIYVRSLNLNHGHPRELMMRMSVVSSANHLQTVLNDEQQEPHLVMVHETKLLPSRALMSTLNELIQSNVFDTR